MGIRASIKGVKTGYPDLEFKGYVKRFGYVNAAFFTPAMQVISGDAKKQPRMGIPGILYLSLKGLQDEIASRKERNLETAMLRQVKNSWPGWPESDNLRSSTVRPYGE